MPSQHPVAPPPHATRSLSAKRSLKALVWPPVTGAIFSAWRALGAKARCIPPPNSDGRAVTAAGAPELSRGQAGAKPRPSRGWRGVLQPARGDRRRRRERPLEEACQLPAHRRSYSAAERDRRSSHPPPARAPRAGKYPVRARGGWRPRACAPRPPGPVDLGGWGVGAAPAPGLLLGPESYV